MEEELEKTKQSYQTQISAHEKKAHNNWVSLINAHSAASMGFTHKLPLKYNLFLMNFARRSYVCEVNMLILQSVLICSLLMFSSWQLEQLTEIWPTSGEKTPS